MWYGHHGLFTSQRSPVDIHQYQSFDFPDCRLYTYTVCMSGLFMECGHDLWNKSLVEQVMATFQENLKTHDISEKESKVQIQV